MGIEIRLLGRFLVLRDGREVPPAAFRQRLVRRLIRILASRRGEFVSRDFLVESLWPDGTPSDPGANLRVLVTLARRALGDPALIQSGSGGYFLTRDDRCVVDAEIFLDRFASGTRLLEQGHHRDALAAFRNALALWAGEPLAEDAFDDWTHHFRSRLLLARLHALEGASAAALADGKGAEAAGWAELAAAQEPLRERSNVLLIEALAISGDNAGALAAYQMFRRLLAEELGLDPAAETQQLQSRILRGEVGVQKPAGKSGFPFPRQLSIALAKPFAGRAEESKIARELLAMPNRSGFLWLLGEPGIGKTTLASLVAQEAHSQGALALFGRCSEELDLPYQPFIEALEWYVSHAPSLELGKHPEELVRLVAEIEALVPGLKIPASSGTAMDQHRLMEAVRSWLGEAGGGRPVVLVLDDLQWADPSTTALLTHIARSPEASVVWVISTARDSETGDSLVALDEELIRSNVPCYRLKLSGLDPAAVEQLVVQVVGRNLDSRLGPFVSELHRNTSGNPLFIESLLRDFAPDPGRTSQGGSIAETVTRRMSRLPGEVRTCLAAGSVAGLEFHLSVVARASSLDELSTLRALEEGCRAALLEEVSANVYRFRHAVVRSVLSQQLSESRRVRLHLAVAEALEEISREHLAQSAETLAMHFSEAIAVGGAHKAYRYTLIAAREADRLLSHDQAVRSYDRALGLLEQVDSQPLDRYEVLVAKSRSQRRSGDMLGALASLREAIQEAEHQHAPSELAKAAVALEDLIYWLGAPEHEAVRILSPICEGMKETDSPLRALLLAGLARALEHCGHPEGARRAGEAEAMAGRLGDPRTIYEVAFRAAPSSITVAEAHLRAPAWTQLAREAEQFGETDAHLLALGQAMWAQAMLGNLSAADHMFAEYSNAAIGLRQPRWGCWVEVYAALRSTLYGRLEDAELHIRRAQAIGSSFGWARPGLYGVAMFLIRREQGRLGEVTQMVRAAAQSSPAGAFWRPGLAAMYLEMGMVEDAQRECLALIDGGLDAIPNDGSRELSLALLAETVAGLGDAARAEVLLNGLLPCEGRLLVFLLSAGCLGPADRLLGMLASVAGHAGAAEEWFKTALELARRIDSPVWTAHTLHDYALHLGPSDETGSRRMLAEAAGMCETHGLVGLGSRLKQLRDR